MEPNSEETSCSPYGRPGPVLGAEALSLSGLSAIDLSIFAETGVGRLRGSTDQSGGQTGSEVSRRGLNGKLPHGLGARPRRAHFLYGRVPQ